MDMNRMEQLITELEKLGATPLSYSKGNIAIVCPLQYKRRYLDKSTGGIPLEKEPAVVGKFIHAVFQYCVEKGMSFGFNEETVDFDLTWHATSKMLGLTKKEYDLAQDLRYASKNVLHRILEAIRKRKLRPSPEMSMVMNKNKMVKGNVPWDSRVFSCVADLACQTKKGKQGLLIDYKSHSETQERAEAVKLQTTIYTLFMFLRFPQLQTIQAGCAYIPDESVVLRQYDRDDPTLINTFCTFLEDVLASVSAKDLAPSKSKYCDWCAYIGSCPLHKK